MVKLSGLLELSNAHVDDHVLTWQEIGGHRWSSSDSFPINDLSLVRRNKIRIMLSL